MPKINGLAVSDLMAYAKTNATVMKHMPEMDEWIHFDRQWICDVIYTIEPDRFDKHIVNQLVKRRLQVKEKEKSLIGIKSEFVVALSKSVVFSCKCTSAFWS